MVLKRTSSRTHGVVTICNPPDTLAKYLGMPPIAAVDIPYEGVLDFTPATWYEPEDYEDERWPDPGEDIVITFKDEDLPAVYIGFDTSDAADIWEILDEMIYMEDPCCEPLEKKEPYEWDDD